VYGESLYANNCYASDQNLNQHQTAFINQCFAADKHLYTAGSGFIFIRHGQTDWSKSMLLLGPQNLPLNKQGISDVQSAIACIIDRPISLIVTSPLIRCLDTAKQIALALGGIPIFTDDGLEERRFGNWAYCQDKVEELWAIAPEGPLFFRSIAQKIETILPEDAESAESFDQRVSEGLDSIFQTYFGHYVIIVAHGCVARSFVKKLSINTTDTFEGYGNPLEFDYNEQTYTWSIRKL